MSGVIEVSISVEELRDAVSRYCSYALYELFTIRDLGGRLRVRGELEDISALIIELRASYPERVFHLVPR